MNIPRVNLPHEYGLDWIDEQQLFEVTYHHFSKVLLGKNISRMAPDPFTIMAQAFVQRSGIDAALAFENLRSLNKTLSNSVGAWHQSVLGLALHWRNLGSQGGGYDLETVSGYRHPAYDAPIIAEVKNKFNTIKASDEAHVWDNLNEARKPRRAVAYLFQIIPQHRDRYDKPWQPSQRAAREDIRCCDGQTAYELVFMHDNALRELYRALPQILNDVLITGGKEPLTLDEKFMQMVMSIFTGSFSLEEH